MSGGLPWQSYQGWLDQVPRSIREDALWGFETYRKALFLADLAWYDADRLVADPKGKGTGWQLVNAASSVAANIEEGFGRGFGKDYARFLRIALGSCRETRGWYYRARHLLEPQILDHRFQLADAIIIGLVLAAKQQSRRQ